MLGARQQPLVVAVERVHADQPLGQPPWTAYRSGQSRVLRRTTRRVRTMRRCFRFLFVFIREPDSGQNHVHVLRLD